MGWYHLDIQTMRDFLLVPDPPAGHAQGGCWQKDMQAALPLKHKQQRIKGEKQQRVLLQTRAF